jgi:hypothetical protein
MAAIGRFFIPSYREKKIGPLPSVGTGSHYDLFRRTAVKLCS